MRKLMIFAAASAIAATLGIGAVVSEELTTLRGPSPNADVAVSDVAKQEVGNRFERAYRQQPPLIPHQIDRYQIDMRANQCLNCHDWSVAAKQGAPTLSMTHYLGRDGQQLDTVAGTRWFCNQCHVPQADAKELVENKFKPSSEVK
ncbi:MAG: nitrate reductase cytochrome c-type subunit [Hyphomicrobiaceae bacterium]|nr:nitrate reductase cytochrome c-type subunit [Hyphomicrobiaceae bacterium]